MSRAVSLGRAAALPAPEPAAPRDLVVPHETLQRIAEASAEADRTGSFPSAGIAAVHEAGLLHATLAPRYGGPGGDAVDVARIIADIGRVDPSVALIVSMTLLAHLAQARDGHWPEAAYRQLVAEGRRRPILLNAARVEPELGSPARGGLPQTLARRTSDGWRISGTKRFVTGSEGLTHFLVWASTDETPARVGTFIVTAQTPGIRIILNWNSLGMRATSSHDVVFEDVAVPEGMVFGLAEAGAAAQDNRGHAVLTLVLTALYLGVGEAALETFLAFARARVPAHLGRPIAETERIIAAAGEIDLLVTSARAILFDALIHHRDDPEHLVRARLLVGRQLQEGVGLAVRTLGNPGLSADLGLERHFRDIQSVLVHAPQPDTALALLGRAAFARPQGAGSVGRADRAG